MYNTVVSGAGLPGFLQLCHLKKYEIASVNISSSFSSMEDNGFILMGSFNCRDGGRVTKREEEG